MKLSNAFKQSKIPKQTSKGFAGYDNPRENIDPHIKTQAISGKELNVSTITTHDLTSTGDVAAENIEVNTLNAEECTLTDVSSQDIEAVSITATSSITTEDIDINGDVTDDLKLAAGNDLYLPLCKWDSKFGRIFKGNLRWIHDYLPENFAQDTFSPNVFIGNSAGNTTMGGPLDWSGCYNIGIGVSALNAVTSGYNNMGLGVSAGKFTTTGYNNAFVGTSVGYANTTGFNNTGVGRWTLKYNKTGDWNIAIGSEALMGASNNCNVSANCCIGYRSGYGIRTGGNYNTLIGYKAGDNITTGSYNFVVGYDQDADSATADYQMNLGGCIFGELDEGGFGGKELSSDPTDPPNGSWRIWQSDGTDSGDDGDIMIKITDSGGTTKTATLVDYSTL